MCTSLPPTTKTSKLLPSSKSNMASIASVSSAYKTVKPSAAAVATGGVDEDVFMNSFEMVPRIQIYTAKEIEQYMTQINETLSDTNNDWEKRVDSLKRIRSLAIACSSNFEDEFYAALKLISVSFTLQIKDLRSQIVREACITIAYLSQTYRNRLDIFAEQAMTHLINLIQNSAKVMAFSGIVAIRFLIENTHTTRLIPLIASGISSRSKEIRRYSCEFLNQLLQTWETQHLEKHVQLIQTCIKKGIADADQEARVFARKAFWSFSGHYPSTADSLLNSLDLKAQKLLQSGSQGAFGSVKSLKDGMSSNGGGYHHLSSNGGANDVVDSSGGVGVYSNANHHYRGGVAKYGAGAGPTSVTSSQTNSALNGQMGTPQSRIKRSTSAVDIKNSRSNSIITSRIPLSVLDSANTSGRTASSRIPTSINPTPRGPGSAATGTLSSSRIAHSQPGSRSTSPTPKYSYLTHYNGSVMANNSGGLNSSLLSSARIGLSPASASGGIKSKIPTSSRTSSRESSPGRRSSYGGDRRTSLSKQTGRRLFKQLTNNQDSEQAIAMAMANKYPRSRRWDDSDDASETSSICSERSFSSSIGGARVTEDMNEAITCLSSSQWADRRDGLINLKNMMQSNRVFSRQELKRLCEIFSKLFQDPHTKVFMLFLDTLNEFIRVYKRDLKEWLYVLLTRLLTKLGSESLASVYQKLCMCLEATRSSFDLDLQFKILTQFIKDLSAQTSNLKVKVAVLKYLQDIICLMEAAEFHANDDLKYAVCKIVTLTAEPKSGEMRKTAQAVLVALFNLNTPEFSILLSELPKNIQETASRILRNHIKNLSQEGGGGQQMNVSYSPHSSAHDYSSGSKFKSSVSSPHHFSEFINSLSANFNNSNSSPTSVDDSMQFSHVIKDIQNLNVNSNSQHINDQFGMNNNHAGIKYSNYLGTSSKDTNGKIPQNGGGSRLMDAIGKDGPSPADPSEPVVSAANLPSIDEIIHELKNEAANSYNQRLKAMKDLTDLIKTGNRPECKWNENFKNVLLCLFNHLDAPDSTPDQALTLQTLKALRELLQFQYKEFANYIELTILRLIDKFRESPANDASKLVEEVIYTAARCLPPEQCARVLKPLIEKAEYPKNLIAIRMMQKTIDQMSADLCNRLLGDNLSALLVAWDSTHSPVRKAAVFCLVSIYMVIGEALRPHLNSLSSSKLKLLNVYINRAKEAKEPQT